MFHAAQPRHRLARTWPRIHQPDVLAFSQGVSSSLPFRRGVAIQHA